MPQNIYDDPTFFAGYRHLRETGTGLNDVLEQPALRKLLPDLAGKQVLELGCGMGQFAFWCVTQNAAQVTAVDVSEKMLTVARETNADPRVTYRHAPIENLELPGLRVDVVVSSLALHYVEDYAAVVRAVHDWLTPGGSFIFSVEHPLCTAILRDGGWVKDDDGNKLFWAVDHYGDEGKRRQNWIVSGVVKYHRTLATYLNSITEVGLQLVRVEEPEAVPEALAARPDLIEERRRPPFLLVKAVKPRRGTE